MKGELFMWFSENLHQFCVELSATQIEVVEYCKHRSECKGCKMRRKCMKLFWKKYKTIPCRMKRI